MTKALVFPDYNNGERAADRVIHCIGVPLGMVAALLLVARVCAQGPSWLAVAVALYAAGLVGMLSASAAYNWVGHGMLKERLRQLDRAMIYVMIAGTYTPISAIVLFGRGGLALSLLVWLLAGIGVYCSVWLPRRFEKAGFALYILMGWLVVALLRQCFLLLPATVFWLIVAGGLVYTVGAVVQALTWLRFHNPVWHVLVLLAAALQYAAISLQATGTVLAIP